MGKNSLKWYVACHGYLKNHQSYIEKLPKNRKMTPLTIKNGIFKKLQKPSISNGARISQPKYHTPRYVCLSVLPVCASGWIYLRPFDCLPSSWQQLSSLKQISKILNNDLDIFHFYRLNIIKKLSIYESYFPYFECLKNM